MTKCRIKKVNDLCRTTGPIIRASTLRSAGFCGKDTDELIQLGILQRLRRGYYASPVKLNDMDAYEITTLVPMLLYRFSRQRNIMTFQALFPSTLI
jgi:hypothetical protein